MGRTETEDWPLGLAMAIVWFGTWAFGIYAAFAVAGVVTGLITILFVGLVTYFFIRYAVRRYG